MKVRQDVQIAVVAINERYRLKCDEICGNRRGCALWKLQNRLDSDKDGLMLVSLCIGNDSAAEHSLPAEGWELVDEAGFAVGAAAICEALLPADFVHADSWSITPGTCIRTQLAFPRIAHPSALIYAGDDVQCRTKLGMQSVSELLTAELRRSGFMMIDDRFELHRVKRRKGRRLHIQQWWRIQGVDGQKRYICIAKKK